MASIEYYLFRAKFIKSSQSDLFISDGLDLTPKTLSQANFAIFALDYEAIMSYSKKHIASKNCTFKEDTISIYENQDEVFENFVDPHTYDIVWIAEPKQLNVRLDRQAGSFLLSGNRGLRIQDVLNSELYNDVKMYKFVIPNDLYEGIFVLLRKMNITSKSLYGNLEGLARSIHMQMQIYSVD
jgi:hypothetical protein